MPARNLKRPEHVPPFSDERRDAMRSFLQMRWPDGVPEDVVLDLSAQMPNNGWRSKPVSSIDEVVESWEKFEWLAEGVYLGVCGFLPGTWSEGRGRSKAKHVVCVPSLWADVDISGGDHKGENYPTDHEWQQALQILIGLGLGPSLVTWSSPGGYYAEWLVEEGELAKPETMLALCARVQDVIRCALMQAAGEERDLDATADGARVLRVPGACNPKAKYVEANNGVAPIVRLEPGSTGFQYQFEDLVEAIEEAESLFKVENVRPKRTSRNSGRKVRNLESLPKAVPEWLAVATEGNAELVVMQDDRVTGVVTARCPSCGRGGRVGYISIGGRLTCMRASCRATKPGMRFGEWSALLPVDQAKQADRLRRENHRQWKRQQIDQTLATFGAPEDISPEELREMIAEKVVESMRGRDGVIGVAAPTGGGKTRAIVGETLRPDPHGRTRIIAFRDVAKLTEAIDKRRELDDSAPDPIVRLGVEKSCVNELVNEQKAWPIARRHVCRAVDTSGTFPVGCENFGACGATRGIPHGAVVFTTHATARALISKAEDGEDTDESLVVFDETIDSLSVLNVSRDELRRCLKVARREQVPAYQWLISILDQIRELNDRAREKAERDGKRFYPLQLSPDEVRELALPGLDDVAGWARLRARADAVWHVLSAFQEKVDYRRLYVLRRYRPESLPPSQDAINAVAAVAALVRSKEIPFTDPRPPEMFDAATPEEADENRRRRERLQDRVDSRVAAADDVVGTEDGLVLRSRAPLALDRADRVVVASADVRTWAPYFQAVNPDAAVELVTFPRRVGGLVTLEYSHGAYTRSRMFAEATGLLDEDERGRLKIAATIRAALRASRSHVDAERGPGVMLGLGASTGALVPRAMRAQAGWLPEAERGAGDDEVPGTRDQLDAAFGVHRIVVDGHVHRDHVGTNLFEGCGLLVVVGGFAGNLVSEAHDARVLGVEVDAYRESRKTERIGQARGRQRAEWSDELRVLLSIGGEMGDVSLVEMDGGMSLAELAETMIGFETPVMVRLMAGGGFLRQRATRRGPYRSLQSIEGALGSPSPEEAYRAAVPATHEVRMSKKGSTAIRQALAGLPPERVRIESIRLGRSRGTTVVFPGHWTDVEVEAWSDSIRAGDSIQDAGAIVEALRLEGGHLRAVRDHG